MQRNDQTRLCAFVVASFLACGAAQSMAQTIEWVEIPEGTPVQASGGTHGVEVYENPSPFSTYPFGGTEVADDLHLTSAGNLVSFDFTLFAPITGGPTTTAVVNFYENNPADTLLPSPAVLIATFAFSDLPTGVVFTKTFDLATPVALPQDVWMGVTVGQLGDFPAGLTVSERGVLPTIGFSHDVFFAPPCSIIPPPCGGLITSIDVQANLVVRIGGGPPPNLPPEITCIAPVELWSPDHDLVDVSSAFGVSDPDGDNVTLSFRVFSDETETPDTGDGTGKHARDFKDELFAGGRGLIVRSERRGPEDGRFYIAVITADDGQGGVATAVCILAVVPHDQNQPSLDDVLAQAAAAAADV